jgi:hypothetical protein
MEITTISEKSVKIKGKRMSFAINPIHVKGKIAISAALFFSRLQEPVSTKSFEEEPLIIQGPGEYEAGGVKISGSKVGESFIYKITIDGISTLMAKTSSLVKAKESVTEYDMLLLEADAVADQSVITALNSKVVILYGDNKAENAKAIGKEIVPVSKFSITKEKLPVDTQIVILQ